MSDWDNVYNTNIRTYVQIISAWLISEMEWEEIEVEKSLTKNSFTIKESVLQKDYKKVGLYPIVSQSKDLISGYSDAENLLIDQDLPAVIFGDHTQVVKYIDFPFIIGADGVKILKPLDEYLPKFFYYLIKSLDLNSSKYARHYKNLRSKKIPYKDKSFLVQEKVVAFLDDLQSNFLQSKIYFDGKVEAKILQLHQIILNINYVIHENQKQADIISQLKKAILQEAIAGQLTAEWRTQNPMQKGNPDTDAAALLAQIKAEKQQLIAEGKLKKEKPLPEISPDEIPFYLPDNWVWCRFQEITKAITCGIASTPAYYSQGRIFLSAKNIKPYKFMPEEHKFIDEKTYQMIINNAKPEKGDILMTRVGAGIGESAIIDKDIEFAYYVSLTLIKPFQEFLESQFILHFLNSNYGIKNAICYTTGSGSSQGNLNVNSVRPYVIPLPPLAEQQAIVEKVDRLMETIDQLEQQIKHRKQLAEDLMQTVLREAFE